MWGNYVENWWPLDRRHPQDDDTAVGEWSSTSCSPAPLLPFSFLHRGAAVSVPDFNTAFLLNVLFSFASCYFDFGLELCARNPVIRWGRIPPKPLRALPPVGLYPPLRLPPPARFPIPPPPSLSASIRGRAAIKWGRQPCDPRSVRTHSGPPEAFRPSAPDRAPAALTASPGGVCSKG